MKRVHWEIILGIVFVLGGTFVVFNFLKNNQNFWTAQHFWNTTLVAGWTVVSAGYWRQGTIVHKARSATHVSLVLPLAVFFVQCVMFVKGIYYHDAALVCGALLVNSAVVFDIYQIFKYRR